MIAGPLPRTARIAPSATLAIPPHPAPNPSLSSSPGHSPETEERCHETIQWFVVATALASAMTTAASAAQSDPEIIIYRFPGVFDDGGCSDRWVATVFHCTNCSGVTETIRFVTRQRNGGFATNVSFSVVHLGTLTVATHTTSANAAVRMGTVRFRGRLQSPRPQRTSICTAMTIDAANLVPTGVALRGIRFSPVPGTQELAAVRSSTGPP
jgi:hypothetical protein